MLTFEYISHQIAKTKEIVSLEAVGRLSLEKLDVAQRLAVEACGKIYNVMRESIVKHIEDGKR